MVSEGMDAPESGHNIGQRVTTDHKICSCKRWIVQL